MSLEREAFESSGTFADYECVMRRALHVIVRQAGGEMRSNGWLRVTVVAAMLIAASEVVAGQITRGSLGGTVRDSQGGVVPGATVTVTSADTNAERVLYTDAQGFFRAPALEPGLYHVKTELAGFATVERKSIVVRTASETSVDATLAPAGVGEAVTVKAEAANVGLNKTNGTLAHTLDARSVVELPLPGRNINNLVLTAPNASSTTGVGTFAVNGNRSRSNNYMLDGSDNNDVSASVATSQIVPESVAEFQILRNTYSVEFGRNTGGQINVITKSGSNRFAGDAWDYFQSNGLNSLTNIEKAAGLKTPAKNVRHQMGADFGGPILRNQAFFYGLYQRESQAPGATPGPTVRMPTPAGWAALQNVALGAGQTPASRQAVLQRLSFLQDVHAQGVAFRNLSNVVVNGVPIETGQTNVSLVSPSRYHTFLGRGDYRLSQNDNLTVRYSLNDRIDQNSRSISNCVFGDRFCGNEDLVDTNLAVSNAHIFSPRMLNESRFSLVRRNLNFAENDPHSPTAVISGLFTVGGTAIYPQARITDQYQFSDTVTWTLSRHTLKFGGDVRFTKSFNESAFDSKGTFTFNSLQDFVNNSAFQLRQALQTSSFDARQWQTFLFVQDDFRLTPDFTVNVGVRYELSDVPLGLFGATDPESLAVVVPAPTKKDTNNWAPRASFAWSPRTSNWLLGDGATSIRGGFGIGYDFVYYNLLNVTGSNYPRIVVADTFNVTNLYPSLAPASATPVFNPLAAYTNAAEDLQNPRQQFYSLTMQREVGSYLFEVGYSGSRGYNGIAQIISNPAILTPEQAALVASTKSAAAIPGTQARRLHPAYGSRTLYGARVGPGGNDVEARSDYNAVFFSGTKRFSHGLQFNGSYTYSRYYSNNDAALGEPGTDGSSQRPQSMFNYEAEWARSQYDRPHRVTASYIWEVPGPKTGLLGYALGGWQLAGITQAQSGRPFTIFTGVDSNGDSNTGSDRPNIDPSGSFTWDAEHRTFKNSGYYVAPLGTNNLPLANALGDGNAPRNTERGAGFWNTDLSLMKRFGAGGDRRLLVRIDAFNVFNQDSYGNPVNLMTSASFGQNTNNWGRRILQLSGKISF